MKTKIVQRPLALLLSVLIALPLFGAAAFTVSAGASFTLLPTSDAGLKNGDYWFDAAGMAKMLNAPDLQSMLYYLSDDAQTLRIQMAGNPDYYMDFSRSDEDDAIYFAFLRQVGVDPNAGFHLLPTSEAGLKKGEYWFDLASLIAIAPGTAEMNIQVYLSDDGKTLRLYEAFSAFPEDFPIDDPDMVEIRMFLRQAGVDPFAGMLPVCLKAADVPASGGYLFNMDKYLDFMVSEENAARKEDGEPAMSAREEAAFRSDVRAEISEYFSIGQILFNVANSRVGVKDAATSSGQKTTFTVSKEDFKELMEFDMAEYIIQPLSGISLDDVTMNAKSSTTLSPKAQNSGAEYTLQYDSSDKSVATVDQDGKVTAKKSGKTTITVTATDSFGNVKKASCTITVKYSFVQWLILIFLFGFLWY